MAVGGWAVGVEFGISVKEDGARDGVLDDRLALGDYSLSAIAS